MLTLPPEPQPNQPVSANAFRQLIRAVRSLYPIDGPGIRLERRPGGTVFKAEVGGRGRSAAPVSMPGCYAIAAKSVTKPEEGSEDPAKISATFKNLYYRVGGKTYEGSVEEIANIELPVIVALCIDARSNLPSDSLVLPATMSELQTYEADERYYTIPLYKFDANGNVECDFRVGPDAAMWEF